MGGRASERERRGQTNDGEDKNERRNRRIRHVVPFIIIEHSVTKKMKKLIVILIRCRETKARPSPQGSSGQTSNRDIREGPYDPPGPDD